MAPYSWWWYDGDDVDDYDDDEDDLNGDMWETGGLPKHE